MSHLLLILMIYKKLFVGVFSFVILGSGVSFAFQPVATARYFNGPTVTNLQDTSATVSLSSSVLADLPDEEKSGIYFQYYETELMCIAIYPTPEYCLPKKTAVGKTNTTLSDLKPSTSYTVVYKRDNTIRCITTPCPGNEFESLSIQFVTLPKNTISNQLNDIVITQNLGYGSFSSQVVTLQSFLIQHGYLRGSVTGYFGNMTRKAVMQFQKDNTISSTGFVGPLTRKVIMKKVEATASEEKFEGTITAYSTGCFSDGECSVSVDGKKVVTTLGRSQEVVGTVLGIPDFGALQNKIGAYARVYAMKAGGGYTLYGNKNYYIVIE